MQNSMNSMLIFIFSLFFLHFFFFLLQIRSDKRTNPFFCKFASKNQSCQFKRKFCNSTQSQFDYAEFDGDFQVFVGVSLRLEISFLGKFGPKNQNCQLKLKFSNSTNSNFQNSMVMVIFSAFYRKYPFWANSKLLIHSYNNFMTQPISTLYPFQNRNLS